MSKTVRNVFCCFTVVFLTCFILIHPAISDESTDEKIPLNQYGIRSTNPYVVDRFIQDGKSIDKVIVPGPPSPPVGFSRQVAMVPEPDIYAGTNSISSVPALTWCFGCSATSAAMMYGHYDNVGYSNMYAGPTGGGVFPMTNATWGTALINGETRALCPLSATRQGLDGRAIRGHVDDYWIRVDDPGPDPFIGNWTEHTYGECTGDYMGTNQSLFGNVDGSTTFYNYTNGAPLYDYTGCEPAERDGCHGLRLFAESRGYTVLTNFSQYIYGYNGNTQGFTFANFKSEIDAGRPVLIQIIGHTMLGYGYNDIGSTVYIHDTWDYSDHSMTWGGSYAFRQHTGVGVLRLAASGTTPTVTTTAASSITSNTASSGGNVTSDGGASVTARGVCWNTTANPTISGSKTADGTGTGSFTSSITGLIPGTTYHVRAYATNSVGTGYGTDLSFTTSSTCPTCSGGAVVLNGDTFPSGETCVCTGTTISLLNVTVQNTATANFTASTSITVGSGTTFESGSNATLVSPNTTFQPGSHVESGAVLNVRQ